jgi:hypothetical protein
VTFCDQSSELFVFHFEFQKLFKLHKSTNVGMTQFSSICNKIKKKIMKNCLTMGFLAFCDILWSIFRVI